jgi:hypothetical protein
MEAWMNSWEIRKEIDRMVVEMADLDEAQTEAWWLSWNHLTEERNQKVLSCRFTKERAEVEEGHAREMAAKWSARVKRMKALREKMGEVSLALMIEMGDDKASLPDGSRVTVVTRKGYEFEGELNPDIVPARFVKREVAKGPLKTAMKKGEVKVEGLSLREKEVRFVRWLI